MSLAGPVKKSILPDCRNQPGSSHAHVTDADLAGIAIMEKFLRRREYLRLVIGIAAKALGLFIKLIIDLAKLDRDTARLQMQPSEFQAETFEKVIQGALEKGTINRIGVEGGFA